MSNADRPTNQQLIDEFAAEHAKRMQHVSVEQERALAWKLMSQMSQTEAYRKLATPAARMAHERELLASFEAIAKSNSEGK